MHNTTPGNSRLSPLEIFSAIKSSFNFTKFHTFRSPVSIVELTLQVGIKIPCWQSRLKLGIYLRKSSEYTGNVSLVFNPITNFVSTLVLRKRVNILPPD